MNTGGEREPEPEPLLEVAVDNGIEQVCRLTSYIVS